MADRCGLFGRQGPPDELAVAAAGDDRLAARMRCEGEHPAIVARERGLPARGQVPAAHRAILGTRKDIAAGRVEPAGDQRGLWSVFLDNMRLFLRGRHASSSLIAEAVGSATWICAPIDLEGV